MTAFPATPLTTGPDGTLVGPWRLPVNLLRTQTYEQHASIHDDATAQRLGFRGGTVEGPTHFSQLTPLLIELFGPTWFETGCISANYRNAAYEGEEVQARVAAAGAGVAQIAVVKRDGTQVLTGNATLGKATGPGAVSAKLQRAYPLTAPRILAGAQVGMRAPSRRVRMDFATRMGDLYPFSLEEKLAVITEDSPWYQRDASTPWSRTVMPIEMISVLCQHVAAEDGFPVSDPVVGLFADQEIRLCAGPVSPETCYVLEREIIALTETPKTESMWLRSRVFSGDLLVAEMVLNQAFLKASSPLYDAVIGT
jgi:hypothetical protein